MHLNNYEAFASRFANLEEVYAPMSGTRTVSSTCHGRFELFGEASRIPVIVLVLDANVTKIDVGSRQQQGILCYRELIYH